MIGLMLIAISVVSADIPGVAFVTPVASGNISGTNYLINWTNTGNIPGLNLQYKLGACNSANPWQDLVVGMGGSQTTYSWNTASLSGAYCLRINEIGNETLSGNFSVDNTAPVADFAGEPYTCNEASTVTLNASSSYDTHTGIMAYEWELDGDSLYDDGTGVTIIYTCPNGPAINSIAVRVRDFAGNTDTEISSVNVSNVAPVCSGITAFADSAVTEPVIFTETATDVADALTYNWNLKDGSTSSANPVTHTYNTAGTYNVTVTVSDGVASCVDSHVIMIVNPTILPTQEVMALQNLNANFTPMQGVAANSFASGLTGGVACAKRITEPSGLTLTPNGNDCVVSWNSVLNNNSGINYMVVRVDNGTTAEYYAFTVMVYSWKINLSAGWNLISIPVMPVDNSIQSVLFDQLYSSLPGGYEYVVWSYQYDASTDENKWLKSRRTGYGDLDYIEPGHAYWINMSSSDILYGWGDKLIAAQTPPSKTIISGWNLIGHYGLLNVAVDDALESILTYKNSVLDETGFPVSGNFMPAEGYWLSTKNLFNGQEVEYTPSNESYNFN